MADVKKLASLSVMADVKKLAANLTSIQIDIVTETDWDEAMKLTGLLVIDAYQDWCGPCVAMLSTLKKLKIDLSDDLLHFAIAKADGQLQILNQYRGDCIPTWLFYAGREFLGVLKGTNAPLIIAVIKELLEIERKFLKGETTRKMVADVMLHLPYQISSSCCDSGDEEDYNPCGTMV